MRQYLMEFLGTMFWVLAIGFSGNPIAIGVMIMVMVYMGEHISGAHYNPAVTLAVWMRGKIGPKDVAGYMIAQVVGAFAAALIFYLVQERTFAPAPVAGVEIWKSIFLELLFTFVLSSVYLAVTTSNKLKGNYIYGLAIGFTVLAGAFSVGNITGGAFNPAVALGPQLMDTLEGGTALGKFYIYFVGCFGGGALAAIVYKYLNPDEVN